MDMNPEKKLREFVEQALPEFAKACQSDAPYVILNPDAFAVNYDVQEYTVLGKAIKYASLWGKEVRILGRHRKVQ